jgi:hypothetical protein
VKRYMMSLELKLVELPEPEHESEIRPGDDPMQTVSRMLTRVMPSPGAIAMPYAQPSGFDFRKQVAVTVPSFSGLAKIIEQYDQLTQQIELERP